MVPPESRRLQYQHARSKSQRVYPSPPESRSTVYRIQRPVAIPRPRATTSAIQHSALQPPSARFRPRPLVQYYGREVKCASQRDCTTNSRIYPTDRRIRARHYSVSPGIRRHMRSRRPNRPAPWWKLEIGIGKSGKKIRPVPPVGNTPTRRPLRMVQLKGSDTGAPFQGLPRMEDQQKIPWKKVRMQMRRCKDQFQIRNLFTDERWILQFLSSTAVERWMPATDEEDIESQVSEWELKERE